MFKAPFTDNFLTSETEPQPTHEQGQIGTSELVGGLVEGTVLMVVPKLKLISEPRGLSGTGSKCSAQRSELLLRGEGNGSIELKAHKRQPLSFLAIPWRRG